MLTFARRASFEIVPVDDLLALPRRDRSDCFCYACDGELTAKLGSIRAHHFAHRPDSTCYAATGEGAAHLAAKLHLKREIELLVPLRGRVSVVTRCPICHAEHGLGALFVLQPGDEVAVERQHDRLRPDLMILREGNPIGIVEVVFTHECSDEKWSRLGGWGNTAVEVTTEEILGNSDYARWVPARPLPLVRGLNLPRGTICDDCIERDLAAKREAAARTREEERRWNTPMRIVLAVCFVDLLFKDGRRRAQRLVLSRVRRRGAWESARLVDQDGRVLSSWEAPVASDQDLLATAKETARLWIQPLKEKHARIETNGGFRSVPDDNELEQMELCAAEDQEAVVVKMKFFPRLWWSPQTTHWVRCYSYRETAEKLGIETHTFYKWRDSAKIRFIEVQHHRGSKAVRLPDADGVDGFASWLDRRRAERGESRHRPEPASLPSDDRFLLPAQIESTRSPPSAQAAEQSIDPIGVRGRAQER